MSRVAWIALAVIFVGVVAVLVLTLSQTADMLMGMWR